MHSSGAENDEVLVVGAGPSGLMAALQLARFDVPVRIIDKAVHKTPYSRAIAVQIRTLEIFSALGLLAKLTEKAQEIFGIEFNAEGRAPIDVKPESTTSTFLRPLIIDQPHTEAVLEKALSALGVVIERGVMLKDFSVTTNGIKAELVDCEGKVSVQPFSYIIGADGAHSLVRKKMATSFAGTTYDDAFILADALCFHDRDDRNFRIFFKGRDFLALIPMYGPNHYRLISVRRNERSEIGPPPTIDEFRKLAKKVVPFPLEIGDAAWVSRFFVQCRSASHYQDGRIFLIGDAAHVHSPAGGQGMNTGLQDALNLSFKLAMVWKGLAPCSLLFTYDQERKPVGEYLLKHTDKLFRYMVGSSWAVRLFRAVLLPYLARSKEFRTQIFRIASQTAIRYNEGLLCLGEQHISVPYIQRGVRIPNAFLMDNHLKKTDIHRLACTNFFTCFIFFPKNVAKNLGQKIRKQAEEFAQKHEGALKCIYVFASDFDAEKIMGELDYCLLIEGAFLKEYGEPFFVVTRADTHVFCLGSPPDFTHVDASISAFIGLQVPP